MNAPSVRADIALGVNIDHVATLRQARRGRYPDPLYAALMAEEAGADSITLHLREDRRHIQDCDVAALREALQTRMNLELAVTDEMLRIAKKILPQDVCFVPESRHEVTTEGGLNVLAQTPKLYDAIKDLSAAGIRVSLFIDPDPAQIEAAQRVGAPVIELHTGVYANAADGLAQRREIERLQIAASLAASLGLTVNAGHGLNYRNVAPVAAIAQIVELNIGHAIVARAVFDGLKMAVREMKAAMRGARA